MILAAAPRLLPFLAVAVTCIVSTLGCSRSASPVAAGAVAPPAIPADVEPALLERLETRTARVEAEPGSAEAWGELGIAYDVHEHFDPAIACYERAAALDPTDHRWPYLHALTIKLADPTAARTLLATAATLNPDSAAVHAHLGQLELDAGNLDAAGRALQRAVTLDPTMLAPRVALIKLALAREDPDTAGVRLEEATRLDPRSGELASMQAKIARARNSPVADMLERQVGIGWRPAPITDEWRTSLWREEGVTMSLRRRRAEAMGRRGDIEGMEAEWQTAAAQSPESPDPWLELAEMQNRLGRHEQALDAVEQALERDPGNAKARFLLGNAHVGLGALEEAIASFEAGLELDPDSHETRSNLGATLVRMGRTEEGLAALHAASEAMPNNADAKFNLGMALNQTGSNDEALAAMDAAVRINPEHGRARFERGLLRANAGAYAEAAEDFEAVTRQHPDRVAGYTNLAEAYRRLGDTPRVVEAYQRGLEHVREHPRLLLPLAWILATNPDDDVRDGTTAVQLAQRLCQQSQYRSPAHLEVLAAAAAERGDFNPATRYAQQAIDRLKEALPPDAPSPPRLEAMQSRLELYQAGKPYRDTGEAG
ncbi:MAG: tetratricopeptide repeat protein [Phycisphaerales bacterium]|nr:tetratricopeptide repeat protein [Phycisphaerae bacterium]NNF44628.1 tetratricopeptide repeat protein [Phycisphaerales bacterium]NNM26745.1 tetratricopeptide repeat protein [Phycisphaerales bacterium]